LKRQIVCNNCALETRQRFPFKEPYPGEFVAVIDGAALDDYLCDLCGIEIAQGAKCAAFSIWTKNQERLDWEKDFIKIKEVKP